MIVSSLYCVCYFGYLFAYWSCLPEKTEMPPPDAPDTPEQYKHETIAQFTRAQWYEWDHLVRSPIGWIPNFPNKFRDYEARMKFNPLISDFPGGWITLYRQVQDWFKDVSKPEYGLPAPIDNRITVSFELTCLIDAKYDVNDGWSFRLRKGSKYFLRTLAAANCELVLYTNKQHADLQVFADILATKTNNLLDLKDGCNVRSFGVNYKLYRNSCDYVWTKDGMAWNKSLKALNRDMNRLIHVDWSPREFGIENEQNCIFLEQPDGDELTLPEIADHIVGKELRNRIRLKL